MKQFYLAMSFIGTILPLSQLIIWVKEHVLDVAAQIGEIGQSKISMFGWYDVLVSAVVLFAFILYENSQRPVRRCWVAILGTCCVGVSLGLPLFLLIKETNGNQRRG
ncbi:MAG: DUF2834 domain-containing protein [SAR324 cluster bacterium]|nr:DUF2834 domain-containing protein [SAR324 cluster bacterium]